jgi:hypothetical protein
LHLVDQPVAHSPDDPLALEIKVFNDTSEPLGGFAVTVGVAERVLSRSALQDALENLPEFRPSAFTRYFEDREVPSGSQPPSRSRIRCRSSAHSSRQPREGPIPSPSSCSTVA